MVNHTRLFLLFSTMNSHRYATKYVPIGYRTPSPEEIIARRTARDLKIPTALAIRIAAPQMAGKTNTPTTLATLRRIAMLLPNHMPNQSASKN